MNERNTVSLNVPRHIHEAMGLMKIGNLRAAATVLKRGAATVPDVSPPPAQPATGAGAFTAHTFADAAGSRPYKLFVPSRTGVEPRPLLVMLHGCTQDPDDFATGTRMNALAEAHGCYVAYPGQPQAANAHKCWNWFRTGDQQRGRGEPAILAALVRHLVGEHEIDATRVYVAGMSAGGAMAVILGATHPELFAAVGVHSGLPYRAAHDVTSALAAMKAAAPCRGGDRAVPAVPTIVFHGDADATVDPCNGERVVAAAVEQAGVESVGELVQEGEAQGLRFTRTEFRSGGGRALAEHWRIHGGAHRWSGGDAAGSHTDTRGPDASREMLRFFLERARA
jgi:poly(hydroxyalkanoate) depolymerase family esterase